MRRFAWAAVVLASVRPMAAQFSNATCLAGFEWMKNDKGLSPCEVAADLENVCQVIPNIVTPIPVGTHYLGPSFASATPCICSTVTYSLFSACGACQNRNWSTWTAWQANCPQVSVGIFPKVPTPVDVPSWAFLNVTASGNDFDIFAAQRNATAPVPSSTPSTISQSASASALSTSDTSSESSPAAPSQGSGSKVNAGAIAGGVVGGLAALVIAGLLIFWFYMRRYPKSMPKDFSGRSIDTTEEKPSYLSPSQGGSSMIPVPYNIYEVPQPPMSPTPSGTAYTTYQESARLASYETLPHAQGTYAGAPEI